jgi:hypothetical protein
MAHAVMFRVTLKGDDEDEARGFLEEQIVPNAKAAPGFVSGVWARFGDQGRSMVVFESEDAAKQWAEGSHENPPPAEVVEINSVEIGEVQAQA